MTNTKRQPHLRINSDAVLKELVQAAGPPIWSAFFGRGVKRFLNIEFAATKTRRVDLLIEETNGALTHLEFQGNNDANMPWRELEYYLLIFQQTGCIPRQIVIYVGRGKLRMPAHIAHPMLKFEYVLLDIRTIDATPLLASSEIAANIVSLLCKNGATRENLRRIMGNIGRLRGARRKDALTQLTAIAGLRVKQDVFFEEATEMGLQAELKENLIFRGFFNDGLQQGRQEEGANILRILLQTKFGELPQWALTYLRTAKPAELEAASRRFVTAATLEEVIHAPKNGAPKKTRRK